MAAITPTPLRCKVDNLEFGLKAFESDFLAKSIIRDGLWERHLTYAIPGALRPGAVFFDIGANVGYYTVLASKVMGTRGRVVAVEPSPVILPVLKENVARENCPSVTIEEVAVGAAPGEARIVFDSAESGGSHVLRVGEEGDRTEVVTLDMLAEKHGPPTVIKADVEGLEGDLLMGGVDTFKQGAPVIFMEFAPQNFSRSGTPLIDALKLLDSLGYRFGMFRGHSASARMPIQLSTLADLATYWLSIDFQGHMDIVVGRPGQR